MLAPLDAAIRYSKVHRARNSEIAPLEHIDLRDCELNCITQLVIGQG